MAVKAGAGTGTGRGTPLYLYTFYTTTGFSYLIAVCTVLGSILGLEKTFVLLCHMFAIEKPQNIPLTILIWLVIIAIGYYSYMNII